MHLWLLGVLALTVQIRVGFELVLILSLASAFQVLALQVCSTMPLPMVSHSLSLLSPSGVHNFSSALTQAITLCPIH